MGNFRDGQLLPQPLDLRRKSRQHAAKLAQQVQSWARASHTASLGLSTILSAFKLTKARIGRKTAETLRLQTWRRNWVFPLLGSAVCFSEGLFVFLCVCAHARVWVRVCMLGFSTVTCSDSDFSCLLIL